MLESCYHVAVTNTIGHLFIGDYLQDRTYILVLRKIDNYSPFPYLEIENTSNSFHPSESSFGSFLFQYVLKGFIVTGVKT